jgi:hypothetical protein
MAATVLCRVTPSDRAFAEIAAIRAWRLTGRRRDD